MIENPSKEMRYYYRNREISNQRAKAWDNKMTNLDRIIKDLDDTTLDLNRLRAITQSLAIELRNGLRYPVYIPSPGCSFPEGIDERL